MDRRRSALLVVLLAALVALVARPAAAATGPDPRLGDQYGLAAINAPEAWARSRGAGVTVAIVSTGIAEHEDLEGKVDPGFDATGGDDARTDTAGRGTHLAGIVGAATDNAIGIAGVAPEARLVPFKAFKSGAADDTFLEALNRARAARVVLVDIPDDYAGSKEALRDTLRTVGQRTSVVVGATAGLALDDLPVLAVAATNASGVGTGAAVGPQGLAAPGDRILSTTVRAPLLPTAERYGEQSGTGQAAAHVAGAVAVLRGLGANATQAADALRGTARQGGGPLGAGIIDVAAAAAAYKTPPPPPPSTTTTTTAKPAPAVPTTKAAAPAAPAPAVPSAEGPQFDPESELGTGQEEEAVAPPDLEEFLDATGPERGPSILISGRERPWGPLTVGFGLLFAVSGAMSLTFRRLGGTG